VQSFLRLVSPSGSWVDSLSSEAASVFPGASPNPARDKSFTVESRGGFDLNLELTVKVFLAGSETGNAGARHVGASAGWP
jgi:hypothetical protein